MTYPENNYQNINEKSLTGIRNAYTVTDTNEPETEEMNELIVKTFNNTLAEVSLSITSRKTMEKE